MDITIVHTALLIILISSGCYGTGSGSGSGSGIGKFRASCVCVHT